MIKIRQINKNKWISKTKKYDKKTIRNIRWEEEYGKGEKMRIPEKEGRTKKGGRKCLLKVEEKIEEKKGR